MIRQRLARPVTHLTRLHQPCITQYNLYRLPQKHLSRGVLGRVLVHRRCLRTLYLEKAKGLHVLDVLVVVDSLVLDDGDVRSLGRSAAQSADSQPDVRNKEAKAHAQSVDGEARGNADENGDHDELEAAAESSEESLALVVSLVLVLFFVLGLRHIRVALMALVFRDRSVA